MTPEEYAAHLARSQVLVSKINQVLHGEEHRDALCALASLFRVWALHFPCRAGDTHAHALTIASELEPFVGPQPAGPVH